VPAEAAAATACTGPAGLLGAGGSYWVSPVAALV